MILPETIKFFYSSTLEKIKNAKLNKEKQESIIELISNLVVTKIPFSVRSLAKALSVSRQLITKVLTIMIYPLIWMISNLKTETRGRKKIEEKHPEIINQIKTICENFEHVDKSLQDRIIYIDITLSGIKDKLKSVYGYSEKECPCENTIRRILITKLNYKITTVKKSRVYKKIPETDDIFDNVKKKKEELKFSDNNVIGISIDDKTSKYIGRLSGGGKAWVQRYGLDHDTNPTYIVKPFGILDQKTKETFVYCTTSNSTAEYKVNCIEEYLIKKLNENPQIHKLMLFLDNGPENSSSRKLWMDRLIQLSIKYNIEIELVYYPPYHSKYNPIEHFWGVLQRHWNGLIIDNLEKLIGVINSCTFDGVYATGILKTEKYDKGVSVDKKKFQKLLEKHVYYPKESIKKWSLIIIP